MGSESTNPHNSFFGFELASILDDLHSGQVELFLLAVKKLKTMDEKSAANAFNRLLPGLSNQDPDIRCDTIELLLMINAKKTIDYVSPLLKDPVDYVRRCVLQEIEFNSYYDNNITDYLIDCLKTDTNSDIRYKAAALLGKIGDPTSRSILQWARENDLGENYEGDRVSAIASWALDQLRKE